VVRRINGLGNVIFRNGSGAAVMGETNGIFTRSLGTSAATCPRLSPPGLFSLRSASLANSLLSRAMRVLAGKNGLAVHESESVVTFRAAPRWRVELYLPAEISPFVTVTSSVPFGAFSGLYALTDWQTSFPANISLSVSYSGGGSISGVEVTAAIEFEGDLPQIYGQGGGNAAITATASSGTIDFSTFARGFFDVANNIGSTTATAADTSAGVLDGVTLRPFAGGTFFVSGVGTFTAFNFTAELSASLTV
jgi:hypothetical protein